MSRITGQRPALSNENEGIPSLCNVTCNVVNLRQGAVNGGQKDGQCCRVVAGSFACDPLYPPTFADYPVCCSLAASSKIIEMSSTGTPTKVVNPFFIGLLVVGTVFAITACAYGAMTVRGLDPHEQNDAGLMGLLNRWGLTILVAELGLLAVLTVLAIGTDDFWARRAAGSPADRGSADGRDT
jgi:hypothetical protein